VLIWLACHRGLCFVQSADIGGAIGALFKRVQPLSAADKTRPQGQPQCAVQRNAGFTTVRGCSGVLHRRTGVVLPLARPHARASGDWPVGGGPLRPADVEAERKRKPQYIHHVGEEASGILAEGAGALQRLRYVRNYGGALGVSLPVEEANALRVGISPTDRS
jgi:hypothetical protein